MPCDWRIFFFFSELGKAILHSCEVGQRYQEIKNYQKLSTNNSQGLVYPPFPTMREHNALQGLHILHAPSSHCSSRPGATAGLSDESCSRLADWSPHSSNISMLELYIHALCHVTLLLPLEKEYISLLLDFELGL